MCKKKNRHRLKLTRKYPISSPRRDRAAATTAGGANHSRGLPFFESAPICAAVVSRIFIFICR